MAAGGYPPAAPTDPGVPDSGTRLLGQWSRCSTVYTVYDAHRWEGIVLEQACEPFPRHAPAPATPPEPLAPEPFDLISEPAQRLGVAGDSVVGIVAAQLATQRRVLLA